MTAGRDSRRGVLFLQIADPGYYPPLIHASSLMADAGWEVNMLSAPIAGSVLAMPRKACVNVHALAARPTHVISKAYYSYYALAALRLARRLRPEWIYASDVASCGPALLASALSAAKLLYHEHDTPERTTLHPVFDRLRARMLRQAEVVVFPNRERARAVAEAVGLPLDRISVVWNLPRREESSTSHGARTGPLVVHYHGSITPERLPPTVLDAVLQMEGRAVLQIAGYEAPGAAGYIRSLTDTAEAAGVAGALVAQGEIPRRDDLLAMAANADVGLALMPRQSSDVNMRYMSGASNKPFEYMAAGLGLIVSDLPGWKEMFVVQGYGRAVDPDDVASIRAALEWFLCHPQERAAMATRARTRITADWNYDTAFAPVLERLVDG